MVADALTALLAAITSVPELAGKTGMSVGGVYPDPTAVEVPLPAAHPIYGGKVPVDKVQGGVAPRGVTTKNIFIVMLYLDNTLGQNNVVTVQLPILEKVLVAVRGLASPVGSVAGFRFAFDGERLHSITPKKITYEQRYSLISHH